MQLISRRTVGRLAALGALLAGLQTAAIPAAAADNRLVHLLVSQFVGISGYSFTGNARDALGTPKFGGDTTFYVTPAHRGKLLLSGGFEMAGATDHWLPFTGGNQFSLIGVSFRVGTDREVGKLSPFLAAGIFSGHVHSERENFKETRIVPSAAAGVAYRLTRDLTITARYRVTGRLHGVDTDGFSIGLSIF